MKDKRTQKPFRLRMTTATALAGAAVFVSICAARANLPQLRITSPVDGSTVNPGQSISVRVESASGDEFAHVGVVAENPLGFSEVASSVPATFSLTVPTEIACRRYMLTAVGVTTAGEQTESATVSIDVERPDLPKSLSPLMPAIGFKTAGEVSPIKILATFPGSEVLDVTESSFVEYSSSNARIVTVDRNGLATAVSTGNANITVTYRHDGQAVKVEIPVTVQSGRK